MYQCQRCNNTVPAGSKRILIVSEQRHQTFPRRANSQRRKGKRRRKDWNDDPGGEGNQIVHTLAVCKSCLVEGEREI